MTDEEIPIKEEEIEFKGKKYEKEAEITNNELEITDGDEKLLLFELQESGYMYVPNKEQVLLEGKDQKLMNNVHSLTKKVTVNIEKKKEEEKKEIILGSFEANITLTSRDDLAGTGGINVLLVKLISNKYETVKQEIMTEANKSFKFDDLEQNQTYFLVLSIVNYKEGYMFAKLPEGFSYNESHTPEQMKWFIQSKINLGEQRTIAVEINKKAVYALPEKTSSTLQQEKVLGIDEIEKEIKKDEKLEEEAEELIEIGLPKIESELFKEDEYFRKVEKNLSQIAEHAADVEGAKYKFKLSHLLEEEAAVSREIIDNMNEIVENMNKIKTQLLDKIIFVDSEELHDLKWIAQTLSIKSTTTLGKATLDNPNVTELLERIQTACLNRNRILERFSEDLAAFEKHIKDAKELLEVFVKGARADNVNIINLSDMFKQQVIPLFKQVFELDLYNLITDYKNILAGVKELNTSYLFNQLQRLMIYSSGGKRAWDNLNKGKNYL